MDTSKIARYVWIGRNDINWYTECEEMFVELFGREELGLVCKLFAATSINTSLRSNVTLFRKAYGEIKRDLPIGRYLPNIQAQLGQIRAGGELTGRKISSFARAMSGDKNAVVVDIWLLRAFNMEKRYFRKNDGRERSGGASDKQYSIIEQYVRTEAMRMKIEPRQLSAMIWAGVRIDMGGSKKTHYKEALMSSMVGLFGVNI